MRRQERSSDRVLIVEPNPTGHRLHFVRLIIERTAALGREVIVALAPDAEATDEFRVHLSDLPLGTVLRATSKDLRELKALARESRAGVVVVPDGDQVALDLGRGGRWGGDAVLTVLVVRATAQPARRAILNPPRRIVRRLLLLSAACRPKVRVRVLTTSWRPARSLLKTVGDPITLAASPAERTDLRARHGLDDGRYWFGILGAVDERKNADIVAQALVEQQNRNVGLLVAGKISSAVLHKLQQIAPRLDEAGVEIRLVNRLLDSVELDEYVTACDCLVFAHSNESPSALFGKALLAGTRAITAGSRWLRNDARTVPDHATWSPLDVSSLAQAMRLATAADRPRPKRLPGPEAFVDELI